MARKNEKYTVNGFFQTMPEKEDKDAPTYWERIAPTLITAEEYFSTVQSQEDWLKGRFEDVARHIYGVEAVVTVTPK
jgi:hypothetical protein